ncbi:MAG: prohibitin family protein [Saprospiraceae bacterium]|jgi:regulator of protease activity HflC (stomatin/prohibitin superfamily)|nr:prohibitin family protein [Saprospiraceae bacterium]MBK6476830.1 prohibitin family protein [Saprospiraceae bacterium]MBK6816143.1 prohibitin family protein [Saprospiraceae bacterium]MBK7370255.1 prohibitin family protein [Saprospiraceae bacterium]MBK7437964.1 prohibitin family protein [Saprospiraceae bacterium]
MSITIIGIALFLFSIQGMGKDSPLSKFSGIGKGVGILLIVAGLLSSMVVQIDAGKVGVQSLFGKVQQKTLVSGLNIVNPLIKVTEFDIKTQNYTMSGVQDEGSKMGDDAIRVLSADGLEVVIDVTVLFRVVSIKAPDILKEIGTDYRNVIIRPMVRTKLRDNAVYYDAIALYSSKRDEFQNRIFESIKNEFASRGLELESLLVRNIVLPESVKVTIESKINAEQDAQKMTFVLQKERQEAERKRVEAQGIADYQKILSTGLSDKLLQYEMIKANKEIAVSQNAKVIIMPAGKNMPVFLSDK